VARRQRGRPRQVATGRSTVVRRFCEWAQRELIVAEKVTDEQPVTHPEPVAEVLRYTRLPYDMRRAILLFMLGVFCTALLTDAISVYAFHDVDKDKIGHWNEAYAGLCSESVLFTVIVGGGVALLTLLGRHHFHLKGYSPRSKLGLFLGIGVSVLQYPWDFVGRAAFPKLADFSLLLYLIVAIVLCSIVIVRDNFTQMKLCQASAA